MNHPKLQSPADADLNCMPEQGVLPEDYRDYEEAKEMSDYDLFMPKRRCADCEGMPKKSISTVITLSGNETSVGSCKPLGIKVHFDVAEECKYYRPRD